MSLSLEDVLRIPPDADEEHLRSIGLLPQPAPSAPTAIGSPAASGIAVPKMTPVAHAAPAAPEIAPMTPPVAPAALPLKPMEPPNLNYKERMALPQTSPGVLPDTSQFYENQRERQIEEKAHPWGTPENHPGFLGKIGHVAAKAGNIAGDIIAPGTMALIPGTELNKRLQEAGTERKLEGAKKEETTEALAKSRETSEEALRQAQIKEQEALAKKNSEVTPKVENLQQEYADAVVDAQRRGVDPAKDPKAQQLADAITSIQKETPAKPDTAAQDDQRYEKIQQAQKMKQPVTPEDVAWASAYEKRKTLVPATNFNLNQPNKEQARSDKSFQYNNTQLEKVAAPVELIGQRIGRLKSTLDQKTPQADALVAPELLSIMAGGQGSGLRMNEAEIARIVGGRSVWENLKAAMQKWSTDPDAARSITPDQDKQIRLLVDAVGTKLAEKEKILDDARNGLLDSDDPKEHRKVLAEAKRKLDAVDTAQEEKAAAPAAEKAKAPEGKVSVYDPQGNEHFVLKEKVDKFLADPKYKGWSKEAPKAEKKE